MKIWTGYARYKTLIHTSAVLILRVAGTWADARDCT